MEIYDQIETLLKRQPLPDDCPEQVEKLMTKASGIEKQMLQTLIGSMYESATPAQLKAWTGSDEPEQN